MTALGGESKYRRACRRTRHCEQSYYIAMLLSPAAKTQGPCHRMNIALPTGGGEISWEDPLSVAASSSGRPDGDEGGGDPFGAAEKPPPQLAEPDAKSRFQKMIQDMERKYATSRPVTKRAADKSRHQEEEEGAADGGGCGRGAEEGGGGGSGADGARPPTQREASGMTMTMTARVRSPTTLVRHDDDFIDDSELSTASKGRSTTMKWDEEVGRSGGGGGGGGAQHRRRAAGSAGWRRAPGARPPALRGPRRAGHAKASAYFTGAVQSEAQIAADRAGRAGWSSGSSRRHRASASSSRPRPRRRGRGRSGRGRMAADDTRRSGFGVGGGGGGGGGMGLAGSAALAKTDARHCTRSP